MLFPQSNGTSFPIDRNILRWLLPTAILLAMCVSALNYWRGSTYLTNDAVQYLAGAKFIIENRQYSTDLLYFDDQYAKGQIPTRQTVWPPGTSTSIAILSLSGISIEDAGRLLSMLSYILLVSFVVLITFSVSGKAHLSIASAVWMLSLVHFWRFSVSINSDLVFAASMLASVGLFVRMLFVRSGNTEYQLLSYYDYTFINFLAGTSFFFRYVGVFVIAWSMSLIAAELLYRLYRKTESLGSLLFKSALAACPAIAIFIAIAFRNYLISGSVRGFEKQGQGELFDMLLTTGKSLVGVLAGVNYSDFFGITPMRGFVGALAIAALLLIVLFSLLGLLRIVKNNDYLERHNYALLQISSLAFIYIAGLLFLGIHTLVNYDPRYLLPVIPLYVIIGMAFWPRKKVLLLICIAAIGLAQFVKANQTRIFSASDQQLTYREVAVWLAENTSIEEKIIAVGDGQLLGYYAKRKTFAIPSTNFTDSVWDVESIYELARKNGVRVVVASRLDNSELYEPSASNLMLGQPAPLLAPMATFEAAFVYQVAYSK